MTIADKITRAKTDIDAVYSAGKAVEYDKMWDVVQQNGKRTSYSPTSGALHGGTWTSANFYPKYDIRPVGRASNLFYAWESSPRGEFDLTQRLVECGVVLDTSQATDLSHLFNYGRHFCRVPIIDMHSLTVVPSNTFANCWEYLKIIDKVIVPPENIGFADNTFANATGLENITFEGVIGKLINLQWSTKLSKASITSAVNCLSTTTGGTATFSKTAVNNAFTTDEWTALVNTRTNWTISLV